MKQQSEPRLLLLYYGATIVFLVLDYGFDVNLRVAAFAALPGLRGGYYLAIFACLGTMLWRPAWATAISVVESLVTLVTLILGMALRSMGISYGMIEAGTAPVSPAEIFNFLLSGSVAYYAWNRGMKSLFGRRE